MRLVLVAVLASLTATACNPSAAPNAADDPKRSLGGVIYLSGGQPTRALGTGPMFLTDLIIDGQAGKLFTSPDIACKEQDPGDLFLWNVAADQPRDVQSHHGMRFLIGAGRTLCFQALAGQTKLLWAGFHP